MKKQCPSCGGDCGYTKARGCHYQNASAGGVRGVVDIAKAAMENIEQLACRVYDLEAEVRRLNQKKKP